ncbi:hypothetical protein [uncultured Aliiroseovarius sp.]|uniref:hypothetical protein n=1 Tax=uncultured Aliiroseovarius sp. TaxID=1658783 RepID=UPI00261E64A4|nr:hypothetical protein [uncultured Aliiroseovarius sp.]
MTISIPAIAIPAGHFSFETIDLSNPPRECLVNALGVEVTEPSIARMCGLGNIDPQHGPNSTPTSPAAIEVCLDYPLPQPGARLVTILPDLDSIGGMAVLLLRSNGRILSADLCDRVRRVAKADRFSRGTWPGPRDLPRTVDEILEDGNGLELGALALCVSDRMRTLHDRVCLVADWLTTGNIPEVYTAKIREPAERLLRSIRIGSTVFETHCDGAIAFVASLEPAALRQAYRLAPVIVALNPAYRFASGERGRKFTIARWADGDADLGIASQYLARLENGWGGQSGIKGSPQTTPSILSLGEVVKCVCKGLPPEPNTEVS